MQFRHIYYIVSFARYMAIFACRETELRCADDRIFAI